MTKKTQEEFEARVAPVAAAHSDLLLRITELTKALIAKGVISQDEIDSALTGAQREALRLRFVDEFLSGAERIAREEGLLD